MSASQSSTKQTILIGLMLFSLFFGAGNLIFPPLLGQEAGDQLWPAIIGFLISGVGLPILGVIAIIYTGKDDAEAISKRVHPIFATAFTALTFLTIGPLFAVPRTATVSFEVGLTPFLDNVTSLALVIFTIVYFAFVYWLAASPGKFIDRIGKIITPILLFVLAVVLARTIFGPLGTFSAPSEEYSSLAFFSGFTEGYLTMDTIAAFVFGILVLQTIKSQGISDQTIIRSVTVKASLIAGGLLAIIYTGLGYLGAVSETAVGTQENGGQILQLTAFEYFGVSGNVILAITIILACVPTAVGLISSCSTYFNGWFPQISYKGFVLIFTVFSALIANMGLNQLIAFSLPVLVFIYPIIIALIALAFTDRLFGGRQSVYRGVIIMTALISTTDGLKEAGLLPESIVSLTSMLPLSDLGFGWLVPAILGGIVGFFVSKK
ncbi:branched-chain amino acid transport system II carrier protein [Geomicrobium sp. JCM 19055]|uniref:branched-chain amino acid transport system II carrier protein n=1 Tax=Geomicrobium sp. JCM 19055 TaxID=1460649 RepID=UPI00045EDA73|nr:branched-chain amino acid transport system II carrier protein [Geomicrobium sp. JCM 19055]GAJ99344.1 branched-chain amino acid transport system carrier protein [Geomicrobium sp. JCM 19055]